MIDHSLPSGRIITALIQTQMLRFPPCRLRTLNHHRVQRGVQQFCIVPVGATHNNSERATRRFDQEAALHSFLATVGWIGTNLIPPKRAFPIAVSAACHSQSTPASFSHSLTRTAQMRSKTPSLTQRWKVR